MNKPRKKWWYPVADTSPFRVGDVVWVDQGPRHGYNEVRAIGRGELMLRQLSRWEVWRRRWGGRWRRFWLRRFR